MAMTADDVEARLIEAVRVWRRLEGGKARAWAGDAPWHLSLRREGADYWVQRLGLIELGLSVAQAVRDPRPDAAMIGRATEAGEWLALIAEADRALVLAGVTPLAVGHGRVPWTRLLETRDTWSDATMLALPRSAYRLSVRYKKAVAALAKRLSSPARLAA
jgi:hypothetical protein